MSGVSAGSRQDPHVPNGLPTESPYAAAVQALLKDGPMKGQIIEVEAVEGRPPMTIDVPDEKGGACRYCLGELAQEGIAAAYTFLYAV